MQNSDARRNPRTIQRAGDDRRVARRVAIGPTIVIGCWLAACGNGGGNGGGQSGSPTTGGDGSSGSGAGGTAASGSATGGSPTGGTGTTDMSPISATSSTATGGAGGANSVTSGGAGTGGGGTAGGAAGGAGMGGKAGGNPTSDAGTSDARPGDSGGGDVNGACDPGQGPCPPMWREVGDLTSYAACWDGKTPAPLCYGDVTLAFSDGTAYVTINTPSSKAALMKFNGSAWESVGAFGFSEGPAFLQSPAFVGTTPYVAFRDDAHQFKATAMRYNGSAWEYVGAPGLSVGAVGALSLVVSGTTPYLGFSDQGQQGRGTVMKLNGTAWENVGAAGVLPGFLEMTLSGTTPYVLFRDLGTGTVMRFTGTVWENVGSGPLGSGRDESYAFSGTTPYSAAAGGGTNSDLTVRRISGSAWEIVGMAGLSGTGAGYNALAFSGATPYVAFEETNFFGDPGLASVMRFNGGAWELVGQRSFTSYGVIRLSLAFLGTTPYLAVDEERDVRHYPRVFKYE